MEEIGKVLENQHIHNLVARAEEDWSTVEQNNINTVRTGIGAVDDIIYGFNNEMVGIIGSSGSRKTTFLMNVMNFNALSKSVEYRIPQVYISVESGMKPERLRDSWLAMRSTQYLRHWKANGKMPDRTPDYLFTDFFKYHEPNSIQVEAITRAKKDLSESNVYILGCGDYGGAESIGNYGNIFEAIHNQLGYCVVYVDHIHAIYTGTNPSDYEHTNIVVNELANLMKKTGVTLVLVGQVSAGSVRANSMEARGGTRLREECGTYLAINYNRTQFAQTPGNHSIGVFIDKSRKSFDKIRAVVDIEPNSGLVIDNGRVIESEATEGNGQMNLGGEVNAGFGQINLFGAD